MSPAPSSHPNQAANLALCDGQHTAEAELRGALASVGDGDAGLLSTLEAPGTVGLVVYGPLTTCHRQSYDVGEAKRNKSEEELVLRRWS